MTKHIHTHYDNLKVARNAPSRVIRAAYRALCKEYHPDINPGNPEAGNIMSIINSSYSVLSDPEKRKNHDAWIAKMENMANSAKEKSEPATNKKPKHSYKTAAGYYPDTSSYARQENLQEKKTPRFIDVLFILGRWASMAIIGIALISLLLVLLFKAYTKITAPFIASSRNLHEAEFIDNLNTYDNTKSTKPVYKYDRTPSSPDIRYNSRIEHQPIGENQSRQSTFSYGKSVGNSASTSSKSKIYSKPEKAPNGAPWPKTAGYVSGYKKYNLRGFSTVTVDNQKNSSSVFVKLYSISDKKTYPARVLYIPERSIFKLESVATGRYDIRYQDHENGGFYKTDEFSLSENSTEKGITYSTVTMTLYKVPGGNMNTYPISEEEF